MPDLEMKHEGHTCYALLLPPSGGFLLFNTVRYVKLNPLGAEVKGMNPMSISVRWHDDKKEIVLYVFEGVWTWDELYQKYKEAIEMETSVSYRVDVILDMRMSKSIPANALLHVKNISDKQPDNLGLSIVVTPNAFVRALYNAGSQFYKGIGHYFRVVPTVDEALRMIAEDRQTHDNQPVGKLKSASERLAKQHLLDSNDRK